MDGDFIFAAIYSVETMAIYKTSKNKISAVGAKKVSK